MAKFSAHQFGGYSPGPMQIGFGDQVLSVVHLTPAGVATVSTVAFNRAVNYIRCHTDTACYFTLVASTTSLATTDGMHMAANQTEYFSVKGGEYISVITT